MTVLATLNMPAPLPLIHERARQRLERVAWHAAYHARTEAEAVTVAKLCDAVADGHVTVRDAHSALAGLRCEQREGKKAA